MPAPFPLALGDGWLGRALLRVNEILLHVSRRLFAFQMLAVVRPRPSLAYLLASAERAAVDRGASRAG